MSAVAANRDPREEIVTPERLAVFAVLAPDGTIVEGRSAFDARMRACDAGYDYSPDSMGFVTSNGRFVAEGREALMLAFRADQLRKNTSLYKSLRQGVIPLWGFLDYGNESSVRGVGGRNAEVAPPPAPIIAARIDWSGVTLRPDTNPVRAAYLQEMARKAGYPPDYNNPGGDAVIVSPAYQWGDDKGDVHVSQLERFGHNDEFYVFPGGETPMHVIEGYQLSDGSFITRQEVRERFANADIAPEGRCVRKRICETPP